MIRMIRTPSCICLFTAAFTIAFFLLVPPQLNVLLLVAAEELDNDIRVQLEDAIISGKGAVEEVEALIAKNPESVKATDGHGYTPLHFACWYNPKNAEVISLLLKHFSGAAQMSNTQGYTPLHYCLIKGAEPKIIKELVRSAPTSVRILDENNWTPLYISSFGADHETIEFLYNEWPAAVLIHSKKANDAGHLPLHTAGLNHPVDQVVFFLEDVTNAALRIVVDVSRLDSVDFEPIETEITAEDISTDLIQGFLKKDAVLELINAYLILEPELAVLRERIAKLESETTTSGSGECSATAQITNET